MYYQPHYLLLPRKRSTDEVDQLPDEKGQPEVEKKKKKGESTFWFCITTMTMPPLNNFRPSYSHFEAVSCVINANTKVKYAYTENYLAKVHFLRLNRKMRHFEHAQKPVSPAANIALIFLVISTYLSLPIVIGLSLPLFSLLSSKLNLISVQ